MISIRKTFGIFPDAKGLIIVAEVMNAVKKERNEQELSMEGAHEVVRRLKKDYPGTDWEITPGGIKFNN